MLKSFINSIKMSSKSSKYSDYSKDQLIAKILELESLKNKTIKLEETKSKKKFDFSKYNTRFIALRFSYLGWGYNGLAIQKDPTPLPTVEGVLIDALNKCKFVNSLNPNDFKFSRCGRTDKGVSALNQVVSLKVRSNLTNEEQLDPSNDEKELDYVNILNHLLPKDIKIHSIALRPPKGFDARFSCTSRHYKYIFHKKDLNIELMSKASSLYEGEHDFRNFCKLDGSKQITNYNRTIIKSQILKLDDEYYCFDLEGSAFLWHQVRNMIGILFLIGQNLEDINIINELLDVSKYPTKPIYDMGFDLPLILYDCKFNGIEWLSPINSFKKDRTNRTVYSNYVENTIKTKISSFMLDLFPDDEKNKIRINLGDGKGKIVNEYVPLNKRERQESFEVVNERYNNKKQKK